MNNLSFLPTSNQIKIRFDRDKKAFQFSMPIFSSGVPIPENILRYIEARKAHTFKPHTTFFEVDKSKVKVVQEIPFRWGFQPTFRQQLIQFRVMSRRLRKMLSEMNIEQKIQDVANLDSDFQQ